MFFQRLVNPGLIICLLLATAGAHAPSVAVDAPDFQLTVIANESGSLVRDSAARLVQTAREDGLDIRPELASRPGERQAGAGSPELLIMPLRSLATQVPALEILELPFLYADTDNIHRAFDKDLGEVLREQVRRQGWELLALWDEGMHMLSGNRRYDRAINLTGMEFILLRADPVAEKQFTALDAWTRKAQPQTREQLLRECMIGSRSASLQRLWYERLDRVHQDLSLSAHRYEGWVVITPSADWGRRNDKDKAALLQALSSTTQWQRAEAQRREADALIQLKTSGMRIHTLDAEQRAAFLARLPAWETLLSDTLEHSLRQKLVAAAATGVVERPNRQ
ncbi:MAG: TRAP transporter substrate-binding protein DctP [Gammaproteobacteria bacterium]|nr:TRAP transporter substrate-binding protein DctP [Gammaproteobacteria bacterium]MDH3560239.1 TRAP transporter substrate-binding protein DctP [Gammaproteobacteria bacterium]